MEVVCAWCKKSIRNIPEEEFRSKFEITHGICENCLEYYLDLTDATLEHFLNRLEAPVLMIDEDGNVQLANDLALKLLKKEQKKVSGFKGGDVMECAYARLPGGCGHTNHCAACTIRNNVMKTHETGQSLKRIPALLNTQTNNKIEPVRFLISTEKVGKMVLLRIDEVINP